MPVKIYAPISGRQELARQLLDAAEKAGLGPDHVRTEKTRGYGYIVSDELAKHLDVEADEEADGVAASDVKKLDVEPAGDEPADVTEDKPKRGRPAGSKSAKGASDGE